MIKTNKFRSIGKVVSIFLLTLLIVNQLMTIESNANTRVGIIDWSDLRVPSNLTGEQLELLIISDEMRGLGEAFARAEREYGVNAMFLVFLARHEGGNGRSDLSRTYNNMFGWTNPRDPRGFRKFESKAEGIMVVAESISRNYLRTDGRHYGGGFGVRHMNKKYAADQEWADKMINMSRREAQRLAGRN